MPDVLIDGLTRLIRGAKSAVAALDTNDKHGIAFTQPDSSKVVLEMKNPHNPFTLFQVGGDNKTDKPRKPMVKSIFHSGRD